MIKIEIEGFNAAMADIDKIAKEATDGAYKALVDWATNVDQHAKAKAPQDEGLLRNAIAPTFPKRSGSMQAKVTVTKNYAPFMEFGTRKFAAKYVSTLPTDWKAYAATFKGQSGGGTFDEFVQRLVKWVLRKGLVTKTYNVKTRRSTTGRQSKAVTAEADAYAIALYLLREGIKPQPFLYPAVKKFTPKLEEDFKKLFS